MYVLRCAVVIAPLICVLPAGAADGRETFGEFCVPCHGEDGRARTPAGRKLGAKDLSESKFTDVEIEQRILNGIKDKSGKDRMPAFKDRVKSEAIPALVAHVKKFRH